MSIPRRTILKLASVGAVTVFSGKVAWASGALVARKSLTNMPLDADDISTYRDFVELMLAKDQSKPLSWLGYSLQHGAFDGDYKFCPHGDWYFLPWHREYVRMYEVAARVLTNNSTFAMPYWNWTELRDYPEAFASPRYKGRPNPLYVPNRNPLTGAFALTDDLVGQTQVIDRIYAETIFERFGTSRNPGQHDVNPSWVPKGGGFQGVLERTPHNNVHNNIGAFMPTAGSPRDPIFFMHHSNIDRIWATWNAKGRSNTIDPLWTGMRFVDNYIDPAGTTYSATVKDLQSITKLGYTYDILPRDLLATAQSRKADRVLALLHSVPGSLPEGVERVGSFGPGARIAATPARPLALQWSLTNETFRPLKTPLAAPAPDRAPPAPGEEESQPEVFAVIRDISLGDYCRAVRVFLNHPDPSLDVPTTDPHFVTTFSFLAHKGAHGAMVKVHDASGGGHKDSNVLIDLTDALRRLSGFGMIQPGEVKVQLVPMPTPGVILEATGTVTAGSIEIVVL